MCNPADMYFSDAHCYPDHWSITQQSLGERQEYTLGADHAYSCQQLAFSMSNCTHLYFVYRNTWKPFNIDH